MEKVDIHTKVSSEQVSPAFGNAMLYEGGISRTTLSPKHVKEKRKNERGKQFNLNKNGNKKFNIGY